MNKNTRLRTFDQNCGARRVLELISPKWRSLVLCALSDGTQGYNDLVRRIKGISPKMLTQTLRGMEQDRLIERKMAGVTRRVQYSLAPLGQTLFNHLEHLCRWGDTHFEQLVSQSSRIKHGGRSGVSVRERGVSQ